MLLKKRPFLQTFFTSILPKSNDIPIHAIQKQLFPYYENRITKLEHKNKHFSIEKFQKVRKFSSSKKILQSFGRIGLYLNNKTTTCIPKDNLKKIYFVLINDYEKESKDHGVGPLNDGYLISLIHHRLGFKIYYLYNSLRDKFTSFLEFFLKSTVTALTVFIQGVTKMEKESNFQIHSSQKSQLMK